MKKITIYTDGGMLAHTETMSPLAPALRAKPLGDDRAPSV